MRPSVSANGVFVICSGLRSDSCSSQTSFEESYARYRPSIDQSVGIFGASLLKESWVANHAKTEPIQVTAIGKKVDRASSGDHCGMPSGPGIDVKRVVSPRTRSRTRDVSARERSFVPRHVPVVFRQLRIHIDSGRCGDPEFLSAPIEPDESLTAPDRQASA